MNQGISVAIGMVMPAASATGLFRDIITFQVPDGQYTGTGFPSGGYVDADGLIGIACQVAPTSIMRVSGDTAKTVQKQEALNSSHVLLSGYYPDAETVWRNGGQVLINGQIFPNNDILAVESDSQHTQTRVSVRVVTE